MLDIGESLVGSYLRYVENCDFVHYETYGEGQGPPPREALPYPAAAAGAGPDYTNAGDAPRSTTWRQLSTLQPAPIHDRLSLTAHLCHVAYCGRPVGR